MCDKNLVLGYLVYLLIGLTLRVILNNSVIFFSVGPATKWQNIPVLGTISSMRLRTNILGGVTELETRDPMQDWEIKADEIKIDFNDPSSRLGSGAFGDVYKVTAFTEFLFFMRVLSLFFSHFIAHFSHSLSLSVVLRYMVFRVVVVESKSP
jgi:hypothetical protein